MFSTRIGKCLAEKRDRAGSAAGARPYFQHTTFGMHAQGIELPRHFRGLFQMHAIKRDSILLHMQRLPSHARLFKAGHGSLPAPDNIVRAIEHNPLYLRLLALVCEPSY